MSVERSILKVLNGETVFPPPIWLMRQAGRYLPEYRQTRRKAKGFLDLCYTPELAAEVTLQPIRRFGFDAAILFSDILVIPDALGRGVDFVEGEGPRMTPIGVAEIETLDGGGVLRYLEPVFETVRQVRKDLPEATALIGFCGGPWTVATYMIAGHGSPDQAAARLFAYRHPQAFERLLNFLADISADYLLGQIEAGADVVQIFDSWVGVLGEETFERFAIRPVRRLVDRIRAARPEARIIAFSKGAGLFLDGYRERTGVDAVGLDWTVPLDFGRRLQTQGAVQGNLDPMRVVAGGAALSRGVDAILTTLGEGPLIFNLGHGMTPDADPENVRQLVERVRRTA